MNKKVLAPCFVALVLASISISAFSQVNPIDKTVSELIYEKELENQKKSSSTKKTFSSSLNYNYINGFINSADRIHQFSFFGSYHFLNSFSASILQQFNQHYFLNPNSQDKGLWVQDTIFYLQKNLKAPSISSQFKFSVSMTAPLSEYSQINNIYTIGTAYFTWTWSLDSLLDCYKPIWIKNVNISIKPLTRYYFTKYTTTPTIGQSRGGRPLPQFLAGIQNISLAANITKYFSLSGSYGRWFVSTYNIDFDKTQYAAFDYKKYLRHFYLLSLTGNVHLNKNWKISLSYSHVDRLNKQGRVEMILLDDRISLWFLGLAYSFSFDSLNI